MALGPLDSIGGIGRVDKIDGGSATQAKSSVGGPDFKKFLMDNLNKVNEMQIDADKAVEDLATGKATDITAVMGAVEKADVAFQTLMAVRNKLVESYQEILRMRI